MPLNEKKIGIMARAPLPGFCKTRLARSLGASRAADLYRAMLLDTLEGYARLPFTSRVLFAAPENDGIAMLGSLAPEGWSVQPQVGSDLGSRLIGAQAWLERGAVLASSDSPTAPFDVIGRALLEWSDPNEALLGPCTDGGYYLIGLPRCESRVFEDIPWSTGEVARRTKQRCSELGLSVRELPLSYDIDEEGDLDKLRLELAGNPCLAPRTRAVLEPS